ncbi:MAG: M28 family peptidase [Thermoproteus sp. AZ2]|uniref:M28 family peptidase n=1 Tax=Thermoproteus sp. AZ2 TaxID=1609232 RepID=A0ACC6V0F9_9CREN|nr:MAG: aminopeptidase [Thermoproteus sp. AZ2]
MGEIARRCASYRDLAAGSPEEREWINYIASILDVPLVWLHLQPVEVLYWRDKGSRIEAEGAEMPVLAMPYSRSASLEGRAVVLRGDVEGSIVLAPWPREINDAKYVVLEAADKGALAVVFYGEPRRRIVVTDELGFKYDAAPPSIPAVSAPPEASRLAGKRIRLEVGVESRLAYSYNVVAMNSFDDTAMISAHYDHWLAGGADNCGGVEAAVIAFLDLVAEDYPVALGLFTAEEGVAPHIPSLYWAWGSHLYFKRWHPSLLVNLDVVGRGSPRAYAMPYLREAVKGIMPVEGPRADYDSLNYEMAGRPAITISSLEDIWSIYHSPLDDSVDDSVVIFAAEAAKKMAKLKPQAPDINLVEYGIPHKPDNPYEAWALVYNYLVLFKGRDRSDIAYVNVFDFLRGEGRDYWRIDLLGGPTLCVGNCSDAYDVYRELVYMRL